MKFIKVTNSADEEVWLNTTYIICLEDYGNRTKIYYIDSNNFDELSTGEGWINKPLKKVLEELKVVAVILH